MRVLVLDEDERQMPQTCELIMQQGHEVFQVKNWKELKSTILDFKPEAFVIDLMIPAPDLPIDKCSGGYTTGAYLYTNIIRDLLPEAPFVVLSASCMGISMMKIAIEKLQAFPECQGILLKGQDEDIIVSSLEKGLKERTNAIT